MALEEADLAKIREMMAPFAALLAPENIAKVVTPIIEAQNKANGVLTAADLKAREDKAKADADAAAKTEADRIAAEKLANEKGGKDKPDPAIAALQKQLAELTAAKAEADAAVRASSEKARTDALHNAAKEALAKAGIPADRVPFAMSHLKEQGVFAYDGDAPGWKGTNPATNTPGVLPMESAAAAWVASDGKLFLPPVGAQGSGDGPGNRGGSRVTVASDIRDANGALNADRAADKFLSALQG